MSGSGSCVVIRDVLLAIEGLMRGIDAAASSPRPDAWAATAVPYIASLGPSHNGDSLTVPY